MNTLILEAKRKDTDRAGASTGLTEADIRGCRKGDKQSQRIAYEYYYKKMFAICYRYSGNADDAKDLLHDGFMKWFDKLPKDISPEVLDSWTRKLFTNHCLDYVRSAYKKYIVYQPELENDTPDETELHAEDAELWMGMYDSASIINALSKLRPDYRVILNLYAVENMSHQQIADALGIQHATSRSKLLRARASLKKILASHGK